MASRIPDPVLMTRLRLSAAGVQWAGALVADHQHTPLRGGWTPHQQVFHLLATEAEVFAPRLRRLMVEDSPVFENWDEHGYLAERHTTDDDITTLAGRFVEVRAESVAALETLAPEQWRRTGTWPDGRTVDVAWVAMRALWHGLDHFATLLDAHTEFSSLHAPAWADPD
jgi:hypothetical protein